MPVLDPTIQGALMQRLGALQDSPAGLSMLERLRLLNQKFGPSPETQALMQARGQQLTSGIPGALSQPDPAYRGLLSDVAIGGLTVYHGSPHKFDKFDMSRVGTGEGAQAYGHGLYLAENPNVAKEYSLAGKGATRVGDNVLVDGKPLSSLQTSPIDSAAISMIGKYGDKALDQAKLQNWTPEGLDAIKKYATAEIKPAGNLYKVDLPDEHIAKMLDWDKPLSQQPESVRKAIEQSPILSKYVGKKLFESGSEATGKDIMHGELWDVVKGEAQRSGFKTTEEYLRSIGIPGIRYLDQGSRQGGKGTSNFVVFDDQLPKIIGKE